MISESVHIVRLKAFLCAAILAIFPIDATTQWWEDYEHGLAELEKGEWSQAAHSFRTAIQQKSTPELNANTYALNYINYLPYFQLGRALLFQGDYAAAMENFDQELSYGVIRKSEYHEVLLRLREIAKTLQEDKVTTSRLTEIEKALTELLTASYRHGQGRRGGDLDSMLAQLKIDVNTRTQIARMFAQLAADRPVSSLIPESAAKAEATADSVSLLRNAAIAAYLQGRYREAAGLFNRLARLAPDEPMLANWQQHLSLELSRLGQAPPEPPARTDTVTIERSSAPVVTILEPRSETSGSRREQVRLVGLADDDVGIAVIDVVVNGELLTQLHPAKSANAFPFEVEVPLIMGDNEVVVTAYDLDKQQHPRTARRRIVRQPPLHQTTAFWLVAGSAVLVVAGAIVGNRYVKYRIAIVNRYNPYIAGSPIRNEEMFFGRQELLERILRTLPNNSLMVFGPRRIGKTSLQYQLQRLLQARRDPEYHFVPVFIDLQGIAEEVFFAHFIEEIREQLGCELNGAIPAPTDRQKYGHREFANDLRQVISILQARNASEANKKAVPAKVRLVFLVDEVDALNQYSEQTNQRLRAIFMKSFSENLVAVLTGSNIRKQWDSESSPWYNFFEQIPIPVLTREEAMRLIHEPVKGFFRFEPEAANKIWEASQGKPFVIQKFCVRLVNLAIERRRRKIVVSDVDSVRHEVLQETG